MARATRGSWGIQRRNSLLPKTRRLPPGEKISSPRRELLRSCYSREISHPQSGHAPLFQYIDAPSGPSVSSHTCRSWQHGVGPNVCDSARQASTRGLMQLHVGSPCLLGHLRPSQSADCDALSRANPWISHAAFSVMEWKFSKDEISSEARDCWQGEGGEGHPPRVLVVAVGDDVQSHTTRAAGTAASPRPI